MFSARDPLRNDYPRCSTSSLVWLVSVLLAAFVLQWLVRTPGLEPTGTAAAGALTLTIQGLKDWHFWTLLTSALLHDTGNIHFLLAMAGLIYAGRELEPLLGPRRFIGLFTGATIGGGLVWVIVHWTLGGVQFGATPAVYAFLVVLTFVHPQQDVTIIPFPVSVRLRYLVYGLLAIDLLTLALWEVRGIATPFELNPSAHLGGMLAGWLYARFLHAPAGWDRAATFSSATWRPSSLGQRPIPSPVPSQPRAPAALRADVDQILDKINSHGFGSLSDEEKRTLDEAKDLLSKH